MSDQIRIDEPSFVARYRESQRAARREAEAAARESSADRVESTEPAYLRAYRARVSTASPSPARRDDIGPESLAGPATGSPAPAPDGPAIGKAADLANDAFLVRHGEVDALDEAGGLSEQGRWQAHSYGRRLSTELADGERVVVRHAGTRRAADTAEQIAVGLAEACAASGKTIDLHASSAMSAFANFRFAGPAGPVDISDAFRLHHAATDPAWQIDPAEPPLWAFELQRLWKLQIAGGDPVQLWLTIPSIHAEPAAMVVRRVWNGIRRLGDEHPGARLVIATHGGVVRAFAIAALGYDPGDPYNVEHVRAKILAGRDDAVVSYRNRHQEISVPDIADLPVWKTRETWQPPARAAAL